MERHARRLSEIVAPVTLTGKLITPVGVQRSTLTDLTWSLHSALAVPAPARTVSFMESPQVMAVVFAHRAREIETIIEDALQRGDDQPAADLAFSADRALMMQARRALSLPISARDIEPEVELVDVRFDESAERFTAWHRARHGGAAAEFAGVGWSYPSIWALLQARAPDRLDGWVDDAQATLAENGR